MGGEQDHWIAADELAMVIRADAKLTVVAATPDIGISVGHAVADEELVASLARVVATKAADTMAVIPREIRGSTRRFQPVNQPVLSGGEVHYVVHRLIDVTDLVALRQHAEAALDAFTFSVSHDLRFPLRVIDGYARALDEDCAEQLDQQGKDYVKSIRGGVARMEGMIESIRELMRIGREPLERDEVDVSAIARKLVEQQPGAREVAIADGLMATADRRLLEAALAQLIANAWKFTSKTAAPRIEIGHAGGALFVRDNGIGFDSARAERLFSPFRKLHSDDYPGVGIGLALAHRVISRHGGRIWAESTPGQGATFYFVV